MCTSSRKSLSALLIVIAIVCLAITAKAATFNTVDRTIIAEYRVLGRERIPIVFVAQPARTDALIKRLQTDGAEVVSHYDEIGYIYARVKLTTIAMLETIDAIDAMEVAAAPIRSWANSDDTNDPQKPAPPSPFLALDNPYTAEYVTQASNFKTEFPTFDGRGVVISIPEPADPSMPSMKGALNIEGLPEPKFAAYTWGQTGLERPADAPKKGNFWQKTEAVTPVDGHVTFAGKKFKLPNGVTAQEWRICARGLSTPKQPTDVGEVALWAVDQHRLWIMLEGKNDFNLAPSLNVDPTSSFLAVRDDDSKRDEGNRFRSWVFVVDEKTKNIAFGRVSAHSQMVASLMAGSSFMGSRAGGVAPAAQIASFIETGASDEEFTWTALQAMLTAFKDARVDIVQSSMLVGDTARVLDPRVPALLLDRLVKLTNKPLSVAAGNAGPALTGFFGMAPTFSAFSVGGYTPRETWLANIGILPSSEITLAPYSEWGPASDGSLKPDFLALTQTLCERTVSNPNPFEKPFGFYTVSGGTSASSPHAAGHLALLISGAKQKHIKYDVDRLRAAIATTAKFLPGVEARAQGYGLIQVADAWQALQRANNWEPPQITSSANLVGRENTEGRRISGIGRGLFEASGWSAGQTGEREIAVTRTKGPAVAKLYQLRWKDNSGAFSSSLKEIKLPLGKPVKIPVTIKVGEADSYSAVLDLIDPEVQLVAHSVLATVFVSNPLNQANAYSVTLKRRFERPGNAEVFVDVPAGLSQLKLHFRRADGLDDLPKSGVDQWQLIAEDPTGRRMPYFLLGSVGTGEGREGISLKGERTHVYVNPVPGVWHFFYQYRMPQLAGNDPRLKGTEITWEFTGVKLSGTVDQNRQEVTFTNQSGVELKGKINALGMGSQRESDLVVKPGFSTNSFELDVIEGTKHVEVEIAYNDPKALVNLYVYRAPEGPDKTFGEPPGSINATAIQFFDPSGVEKKQWIVDNPKAGKYVVFIDPVKVPTNGLNVHYRDVIVHPAFGEVSCADNDSAMAIGASRSAKVSWTSGAAQPSADRKLVAVVGFTSPDFGYSKLVGTRGTPTEKLEIVPVALRTETIAVATKSESSSLQQ
jgi:hypothetical protein